MTLWEILIDSPHVHGMPGVRCPRCEIASWAREKSKFWSDKIEGAYETYQEREGHIVDGIVNSIIEELGVPPEEQK